jgi:hypothetical protein
MRVVISLTTLPGRYNKLHRTLVSMHKQSRKADAIYLGLPKIAKRLQQPYPELPSETQELCTVVQLEQDYGPICKILAGLQKEKDPETIVITIDDDIVYPFDFIEQFVKKAEQYPRSVIGSTGLLIGSSVMNYSSVSALTPDWNRTTGFFVPPEGRAVDILCGVSGIAYRRSFFPDEGQEMLQYDEGSLFYNDDVLISAYLNKRKVERRVFLNMPFINQKEVFDPAIDIRDGHEISSSRLTFLSRFHDAVNSARKFELLQETAPTSIADSLLLRILSCVILVIVIILCIWLFMRST